jgi:hypothetical protein
MTDNEFIIEHNRNEQMLWYQRKYESYERFLTEIQKMASVGASLQNIIEAIEHFKIKESKRV